MPLNNFELRENLVKAIFLLDGLTKFFLYFCKFFYRFGINSLQGVSTKVYWIVKFGPEKGIILLLGGHKSSCSRTFQTNSPNWLLFSIRYLNIIFRSTCGLHGIRGRERHTFNANVSEYKFLQVPCNLATLWSLGKLWVLCHTTIPFKMCPFLKKTYRRNTNIGLYYTLRSLQNVFHLPFYKFLSLLQ